MRSLGVLTVTRFQESDDLSPHLSIRANYPVLTKHHIKKTKVNYIVSGIQWEHDGISL